MRPSPSVRTQSLRLIVGLVVPLFAFVAFRQTLGNATEALAVAEAIPLLWLLAYAIWRRRIEPVGVIAVAGFGVALLLTIASGGSALPLELHRALFPGAVGLACLVSLALGRPLLVIASTKLSRTRAKASSATESELETPGAHPVLTALTAIVGVTLTADAAAQITLAFAVSASTFGVAARAASWAIVGTGVAVCCVYLRQVRATMNETPTHR